MDEIRFYDPRVGTHAALSNLHPRELVFEGALYRTPEHAFQVAKAASAEMKAWLAAAPTPELVAVAGDNLMPEDVVPGWEDDQLRVMERIVAAKFTQAEDLKALLLSTGSAKLVEWAPDNGEVARFWGEYRGEGENWLGRILMDLRGRLRSDGA